MMAGQKLPVLANCTTGRICRWGFPSPGTKLIGLPSTHGGRADRAALNAWWTNRFIPSARSGLVDALSQLGFPNPQQVISRNLGLSLSDHYWVKPAGSNLSWSEVNFFENGFSPDVGDALLGKLNKASGIDLRSPDWTCDGNLRKRWAILDGKRCLVKAAPGNPTHSLHPAMG